MLNQKALNMLDLIRFVALVGVVLFHIWPHLFPGGWSGVDVFFVLSGYLIYSKLAKATAWTLKHILEFYSSRIMRLGPTWLFVVAVSGALVYTVRPSSLQSFGSDGLSAALFLSNFRFWKHLGDYWAQHDSVLLHTWSLSIEEQWYVFLPLALLIKNLRIRYLLGIFLFFTSLIVYLMLAAKESNGAFYFTYCRVWEFIVGVGLTLVPRCKLKVGWQRSLANTSLIALVLLYLLNLSRIPSVIFSCLFTAAAIYMVKDDLTQLPKLAIPYAKIGRAAYPIYLWHLPIIVLLPRLLNIDSPLITSLATLVICISLGFLTSILVESPLRYSTRHIGPVFGIYVLLLSVLVSISTGIIGTYRHPESPTMNGRQYSPVIDNKSMLATLGLTRLQTVDEIALLHGKLTYGTGRLRMLLLGDSHGLSWATTLRESLKSDYRSLNIWCIDGVSPLLPPYDNPNQQVQFLSPLQKLHLDQSRRKAIVNRDFDVIFVVSRWSLANKQDVEANIRLFSRHADKVVVLGEFPALPWFEDWSIDSLDALPVTTLVNGDVITNVFQTPNNEVVKSPCETSVNCLFVDSANLLGWPDNVLVGRNKKSLYFDNNHPSDFGIEYILERSLMRIRQHISNSRNH